MESVTPGSRSSRCAAAPPRAAPPRWAAPGSASRHRPRAAAAGRLRSCSWAGPWFPLGLQWLKFWKIGDGR